MIPRPVPRENSKIVRGRYKPGRDFIWAMKKMLEGYKVCRAGWEDAAIRSHAPEYYVYEICGMFGTPQIIIVRNNVRTFCADGVDIAANDWKVKP